VPSLEDRSDSDKRERGSGVRNPTISGIPVN
jgi:hypothetical protein